MKNLSNSEELIEHHTHYKEIDGYDETVWMSRSEHSKLHIRLRKEGKCNIPSKKLAKISMAAHNRTEAGKAVLNRKARKWQEAHPELQRERSKKCMRNLRERDREAYNRYMREYRARKKVEKTEEV